MDLLLSKFCGIGMLEKPTIFWFFLLARPYMLCEDGVRCSGFSRIRPDVDLEGVAPVSVEHFSDVLCRRVLRVEHIERFGQCGQGTRTCPWIHIHVSCGGLVWMGDA